MSVSSALARIFNILSQLFLPINRPPSRAAVAWEYFILTVKMLAFRHSCPRRVSILGKFVSPDFYALLRMLFIEIFVRREYEFVADREDVLIIDCGGNIGLATLFFSLQYPEARIITLEPSPGSFERLKKLKDWNSLSRVELYNVAAAQSDGEIDFYSDKQHSASVRASAIANRGGAVSIRVQAIRLSTFIKEKVDFLKIDIEGAEMEVVEELASSGKIDCVQQMAIEFHHHMVPNDDRMSRILKILEAQGFGYQLRTMTQRPIHLGSFQDIMIYAYKRGSPVQKGLSATA